MDQTDGPLPGGPAQLDREFSIDQARSMRWNLTTGAARPNPQGTFNVTNVTITQTFILHSSNAIINNSVRFTVNNVSYLTPSTPLKLADLFFNGSGVYTLNEFPIDSIIENAVLGTFVATGIHKGWTEFVFQNNLNVMDSWHLDGFGFYVVGFGDGEWNSTARDSYNLYDPVVRPTTQVYRGGGLQCMHSWTILECGTYDHSTCRIGIYVKNFTSGFLILILIQLKSGVLL